MLEIILGIVYVIGIFSIPFIIGLVDPDNHFNFDLEVSGWALVILTWPITFPIILVIGFIVGLASIFNKLKIYGEYLGQKRLDKKQRIIHLQEDLNQRDFYDNVN